MISSMTGFGKGSVQVGEFTIEAEVKSFNNRFLDLSVKLPKNFSAKEFEIREKIKGRLKRGKIYLSVFIVRDGGVAKTPPLDKDALLEVIKLVEEIKSVANIKNDLTLEELMNFQQTFFGDTLLDEEDDYIHLEKAVLMAVDELEKMRNQEGTELVKDLKERIKVIADTLVKIEKITPESIVGYFEKLKERAKQLVTDIVDNPDRLNAELALLSERYDVTEECVRLRSHLKMFMEALQNTDEVGRKLNFITQEMNREANTINSKSISTEVSQMGIIIKEELEKIREQIQNIE